MENDKTLADYDSGHEKMKPENYKTETRLLNFGYEKHTEEKPMKKRFAFSILLISLLVSCFAFNTYAKTYKIKTPPFRLLKIGSKNLTKYANKECWMGHKNDVNADGVIEICLNDFKGKVKKNSRIRIKLKKGYKYEMLYDNGKKLKKIKNNFRLPKWNNNCRIYLGVKKGNYTAPYDIRNTYDSDY